MFKITLCFLLIANTLVGLSQDSIYFRGDNFIDGEIKEMDQNLLKIDADYGDKDFVIKWDEIRRIYTNTYLFIYTSDGAIRYGWLRSISDSAVNLISRDSSIISLSNHDIIRLRGIKQDFKSRIDAGIDVGFTLIKANELRKFSLNGYAGYKGEKWHGKASLSTLLTVQDQTDPIERYEGVLNYRYLFFNDWALDPSMTFLSSSEQKLDLRASIRLGLGKYIIHNANAYWGVGTGINRNIERFSNDTPDRNSWEGFFGTEIDIYGINDLDLFTNLIAYPSFTESGRWRADFTFTIKYDLPLDLYVKLNCTMNYDNQPADEASETDYVVQLGLGWSW